MTHAGSEATSAEGPAGASARRWVGLVFISIAVALIGAATLRPGGGTTSPGRPAHTANPQRAGRRR